MLASNFVARPYRGVSVQRWEGELEPRAVRHALLGREAYRRTEFLVLRKGERCGLVRIRKASDEPLMSPIVDVQWLAGPEEAVYVVSPETDTGNATALAQAARRVGGSYRAYVVEGLYHHVNFIWDPHPIRVRVVEVVPPEPPKLVEMARRVLAFDEDLPPIDIEFEGIDIRRLAREHPADRYLLPCRGSGVDLPGPVAFLDEHPLDGSGLLIGCERSRQFYRWFFGREPQGVELCPRALTRADGPTLLKCCLLERGLERDGATLVVPWGAELKEVQEALRLLVLPVAAEPTPSAATR
jgi:hypothetical protein